MVREFLRRYASRYLGTYLLGILFLLATNLLAIAIPRMLKEVFDELAGARRLEVVHHYALLISIAAVVVILVRTLSRILFFNPGRTIEFRIRNDMLQRLLGMSPQFYRRWSIGDILARTSDDATFVRALVGFSVIMVLNIVLAAVLALWQMLRTDAWLTLWCVLPLLLALAALRVGVRYLFGRMRQIQEALGLLSNTVLETYKGISVVQGAAAEGGFLRRFDAHNDRFTELNQRTALVRTFLMPIVGVVGNLCIFLLLYIGGRHVVQGRMTLGDLAAYASYIGVLVGALASAGWAVGVLQRGFVSLRRVWDVLSLTPDLPDGDQPLPDRGQGVHVRVSHLSYRHPDAPAQSPDVLEDLCFEVPAGSVLGIYGAVGSGKSTLVSVLGRLTPPARGTVWLDGVDLCDIQSADLRRAVAVVPQDAFLFSRSVRKNVGFLDRSADIDEARVDSAVDKAQLRGEIERLADGLETVVGERGLTLSGGQRQRVQLARAFYRGYRLLILDDVLSAVDHDTEARLLDVIQAEIRARHNSAIVISHRISALMRADEILVLESGRISQRGTHAALLRESGLYARIWEQQRERRDEPTDELDAGLVAMA